jgi:hypothetical protein
MHEKKRVEKVAVFFRYGCISLVCIFGLISMLASCDLSSDFKFLGHTNFVNGGNYIVARDQAAKDPEVIAADKDYKAKVAELKKVHEQLYNLKKKNGDKKFSKTPPGIFKYNYPQNYPPGTDWSQEDKDAYNKLSQEWNRLIKVKNDALDKWDNLIDQKARDIMNSDQTTTMDVQGDMGGGGHCFPADTLVLLNGTMKNIRDIKVGDMVLSKNMATGVAGPNKVTRVYEADSNHYYIMNDKIRATGGESFFTTQGWKAVKDLKFGDTIYTISGVTEKIVSVKRVAFDLKVYNIEVDGNHTFYISPDGKGGYLVHNK